MITITLHGLAFTIVQKTVRHVRLSTHALSVQRILSLFPAESVKLAILQRFMINRVWFVIHVHRIVHLAHLPRYAYLVQLEFSWSTVHASHVRLDLLIIILHKNAKLRVYFIVPNVQMIPIALFVNMDISYRIIPVINAQKDLISTVRQKPVNHVNQIVSNAHLLKLAMYAQSKRSYSAHHVSAVQLEIHSIILSNNANPIALRTVSNVKPKPIVKCVYLTIFFRMVAVLSMTTMPLITKNQEVEHFMI